MSSNSSCRGMNKSRDDQDSSCAWICRAIMQDECLEIGSLGRSLALCEPSCGIFLWDEAVQDWSRVPCKHLAGLNCVSSRRKTHHNFILVEIFLVFKPRNWGGRVTVRCLCVPDVDSSPDISQYLQAGSFTFCISQPRFPYAASYFSKQAFATLSLACGCPRPRALPTPTAT